MAHESTLFYHTRLVRPPLGAATVEWIGEWTGNMQGTIVAQGVELMLYGMGTVAVFLTVLVVATTLMSRFVTRYFPEPQSSASIAIQKLRARAQPADDPNLVAVISAAIHQHRAGRK